MGQKSSKSASSNRFLQPLPELYEKNDVSQVYSLRGYNLQSVIHKQSTNLPTITNPQTVTDKLQPLETELQNYQSQQQPSHNNQPQQQPLPPFLKHFTILLNPCQTRQYLNHLVYRNQPQFKDFIVQMPFGEIQKQAKYTKVHLYVDELVLTLNQVFNLPFYDMAMVLYTALVAYKYLYSYFGHFKIEANMIGFTRQGKAKVWLNHKLTKDKPLPIVSDINLKRFKEEESYMVDDLLTIFSNKVDKQSIPHNFTLLHNTSNIRTSRSTRLNFSRVSEQQDLSKSTVSSLQNNLINDFSDCSFDKCLEYLEGYFNIKRPDFFVEDGNKKQPKQEGSVKRKPHKNFIPSIFQLIKTRKQLTQQRDDLRNSRANININLRQVTGNHQPLHKNIIGLSFRKSPNQKNPNLSAVNRPNFMFNSTPIVNIPMIQIQPPVSNQQVRFTSSHITHTVTNSSVIQPQDRSKSKPKVTFNTTNSLYSRIPQSQISSPSIPTHQFKSNSSLQKRPFPPSSHSGSMHGSMVSPSVENDFSFRITTSQVHPVYSSTQNHKQDLKQTFSSEHIQWKSGLRTEENQDKYDKDSIIDGVTKV